MNTALKQPVYIDVHVRVASVGVYAADIAITAVNGDVIREETLTYPKRQRPGVERAAWRIAREWVEVHGYAEKIKGDDADA